MQDYDDPERLLARKNVDQDALMAYAKEAAEVSTNHLLPDLEFAHNHYGQADVAMFDFTSMYHAEHASRVIERAGHKLLVALVGDSLLEVGSLTLVFISPVASYHLLFHKQPMSPLKECFMSGNICSRR